VVPPRRSPPTASKQPLASASPPAAAPSVAPATRILRVPLGGETVVLRLVAFPGGYGTLNELFEYLVLMQTGMADHVPLICVDRKFWQGLFDWVDKYPLRQKFLTNWFQGIRLLHFIDDRKGIISVIKKSAK